MVKQRGPDNGVRRCPSCGDLASRLLQVRIDDRVSDVCRACVSAGASRGAELLAQTWPELKWPR